MAITATEFAASVFGSTSVENVFAIGVSPGQSSAEQAASVTIRSAERQIKRLRGYKLDLTTAELQKLADIREKIKALDAKSLKGTVRPDEIEDRKNLFLDADKILGKPAFDVESDDVLKALNDKVNALLAPNLDRPRANRLAQLEKLKATFEGQIAEGSGGRTAQLRLQNVVKQITNLAPPRPVKALSISERIEYDNLVEQVNEHAGAKLLLNARDATRAFNLQKTIDDLKASLPPDTSGRPSAAQVARAYTRLF